VQEHFFFNNAWGGVNACYLMYDQPSNTLNIIEDQGTNLHQSAPPGTNAVLSNGQCSVPASSASVSISGNTVTLTVTITFLPSFVGPKQIWATVMSTSYVEQPWQQIGTWTVTTPTTPVDSITINPSSGSGSTQTFTATFTSGSQVQEHFFFNNAWGGVNACYLMYDQPSNTLNIIEDQGTNPHRSAPPGSKTVLSNSQCNVPASSASVSVSGNTVTLTVTITFLPSFVGPKQIWATVMSTSYVEEPWQQIGTWTP
jgi:fructose-1,6-bisphosphatase